MFTKQKWSALAVATLASVFFFQNCANNLNSQQSSTSMESLQSVQQNLFLGGLYAAPPRLQLPDGSTPVYVPGSINTSQAPKLSCSKQTYKVGEYAECKIENADEQTTCWQKGTRPATEKKCVDHGWQYSAADRVLKISVAVVQSIVGDYVIYAKNASGIATLDLHYQAAAVVTPPYVFPTFDFKEDSTANISRRIGDAYRCPSSSTQFPGCTFSAAGFRKRNVPYFNDPLCSSRVIISFDAEGKPSNLLTLNVNGTQEGVVPKRSGWAIQDITLPGCVGSKGTVVNPTVEGEGTYMILGISEWDEAFCIYACLKN